MSADMLTAALDLAERGNIVFPLKPNGKTPAIPSAHEPGSDCRGECGRLGHGLWDATDDPAIIHRWWGYCPAANVGINCGASGLYVLDLDTPKPDTPPPWPPFDVEGVRDGFDALAVLAEHWVEPLPLGGLEVRTGRGGTHLYFRQPDGAQLRNTAKKLGWLIDTRGVGGYVVAPGSIVAGKPYTITTQAEPAPLPRWIRRLADPPPPPPVPPRRFRGTPNPDRYAAVVLERELARLNAAGAGERNDTLNAVAFNLGRHVARGTFTYAEAENELLHAAQGLGDANKGPDMAKSTNTIRRALADGQRKGT
ncbi:bifunctional DNA primase/polymerase [Catenulispora subtropica]|uniref:Bifunctional DNA primase/polymerase n=2 Tax=Catenulispora subtropica TaxID=450798 RepID=A0ABN2QM52_9ACTN